MADTLKNQLDLPAFSINMNQLSARLRSFKDWPFKDDCLCTAEKMAEAGFYHTPSENEPDLVTCYVCCKEMDGWEPTDDPWAEHKNHSKACPFISFHKKQSEWTVEDTINMEIKRHEFRTKKAVEAVIAKIEEQEQCTLKKLMSLVEEKNE